MEELRESMRRLIQVDLSLYTTTTRLIAMRMYYEGVAVRHYSQAARPRDERNNFWDFNFTSPRELSARRAKPSTSSTSSTVSSAPFPTTTNLTTNMLPRHLRRAIPAPAAFRIAANRNTSNALRLPRSAGAIPSTSNVQQSSGFHSSARRNDELPKSPFQTFVEVLKDELKKNRELQDNVKQLQGDVDKFQDSEAMKRAKAAYERARVRLFIQLISLLSSIDLLLFGFVQLTSSIKENPRLRAAAEELKKTGMKVGDAVGEALKSMEESDLARAVCIFPEYRK